MTLARSVADVLSDHVTLEVECIDRMYLNLYVPKLQYEGGVVGSSGVTGERPSPRRPSWTRSPRTSWPTSTGS